MRLGWSPSTRAGLLGTGAMLASSHAPLTCPPSSPTTQNTEGGGVWAEHLQSAPPESVALYVWGRLRACTDLVGRAASGAWPLAAFLGLPHGNVSGLSIFGEVPSYNLEILVLDPTLVSVI